MITLESLKLDFAIEKRKRYWQQVVIMYTVLMVFLLASGFAYAGIDEQLEDAIVCGDWAAVKELACRDKQPQLALESIALGYASLYTGDYRTAIAAFTHASEAVERDPTAVENAEVITSRNPRSWVGYLLKADVLARAGRYDEALDSANRAIELNRNEAAVYHTRGLIYALSNRNSLALEDLNRAIKLNSRLADAYVARGIIRLQEGKSSEAQMDFEEALKLLPNAVAANARGVSLCDQKRYDEALQSFVFALDMEPDFKAAASNVEAAKILSAPWQVRTRITIANGRRAGALGRRTIAVVVTDDSEQDEIATTASATVIQSATGLKPLVTDDTDKAIQELAAGNRPVVLNITLPKTQDSDAGVADAIKQISQKAPDADARIITDGTTAAQATAKALKKYTLSKKSVLHPIKSWDMVDFAGVAQETANIKDLAQTALYLRSIGVEVKAYARNDETVIRNWMSLTRDEKVGLPLAVTPQFNYNEGLIAQLVPQITVSWVSLPQRNEPAISQSVFCSTPNGEPGIFLLQYQSHYGVPIESGIWTGNGIWIGSSRNKIPTPQIMIVTESGETIIRLDIIFSHGQKPHVNVNDEHSDKDGVEINENDTVVIRVGGGKVIIEVNGEKAKEYDVPQADNEEEIVIERKPDGTTTVTVGGKPAGEIIENEDGTITIKVGDKIITVPKPKPPEPPKPEPPKPNDGGKGGEEGGKKGDGKEGGEKGDSEGKKGNNKAQIVGCIINSPGGSVIITPPIPGSDVLPGPHPPRGGIYFDRATTEVVSAEQASTDLLFGGRGQNIKSTDITLLCPFLVFQELVKGVKK